MSQKLLLIVLVGCAAAIPLIAARLAPTVSRSRVAPSLGSGGSQYPQSPLRFGRQQLGEEPRGLPLISNVQILDFDGDGNNEVLVCDISRSCVCLISADGRGGWTETVLLEDVSAPAHVTAVDIDGDGDLDLLVSILGSIQPSDELIGRVELHENLGGSFRRHVLLDDVRRVADIQPGDFDGDGDLDLAVAVFGYARGQVLWLENRGNFQFVAHELLNASGAIHVPVGDFDGDGDLDIVTIISQNDEELWGFENLGEGKFRPRLLWNTVNLDLGSAGLVMTDLDGDGDLDLLLPTGDNLEDTEAYPQPYHGCFWLENRGNWDFVAHRISRFGGTYAAAAGDLDGDGDQDVVLVSMANDWYHPENASLIWLENDGQQNFTEWQIDSAPIHLVTVAVGDLDGDGRPEIVAGSLNLRKPFERIGRISLWKSQPHPQK